MSRPGNQRLEDIVAACDAIAHHMERRAVAEDLVFDAVRMRLIEIGEAVKDIDLGLLATEPAIPWQDIAGMRDLLAHRYFDSAHSVVFVTATDDIPTLRTASLRLISAGSNLRVRQATVRGDFASLTKHTLDHPAQDTLDALRDER